PLDTRDDLTHALHAVFVFEVLDGRAGIEPELVVHDEIVANPVVHGHGVRRSARPAEAMQPAEKRQTERPSSRPPDLLVELAFLTAESLEPRIQPGPRGPAARDDPEPLHRDVERRKLRVDSARVPPPHAFHPRAPATL